MYDIQIMLVPTSVYAFWCNYITPCILTACMNMLLSSRTIVARSQRTASGSLTSSRSLIVSIDKERLSRPTQSIISRFYITSIDVVIIISKKRKKCTHTVENQYNYQFIINVLIHCENQIFKIFVLFNNESIMLILNSVNFIIKLVIALFIMLYFLMMSLSSRKLYFYIIVRLY